MSIIDRLNAQTNALDSYQNRVSGLLSNFDLEKGIFEQTEVAEKGAKALGEQIFNQQQLEGAVLAAPLVAHGGKYVYSRYKSGKSIIPTKEERAAAYKNLKGVAKEKYDSLVNKFRGKATEKIGELQEKANDQIEKVTGAAQDKVKEASGIERTPQEFLDRQTQAAREAVSRFNVGGSIEDRVRSGQIASAEDVPESAPVISSQEDPAAAKVYAEKFGGVGEGPVAQSQGQSTEGGGIAPNFDDSILKSKFNSIDENLSSLTPEGLDYFRKTTASLGLENPIDSSGKLSDEALDVHGSVLNDTIQRFGFAPKLRGGADFRFKGGQLVDVETGRTGEQAIRRFGQGDLPPSQNLNTYREVSRDDEGVSFQEGASAIRDLPGISYETPPPISRPLTFRAPTQTEAETATRQAELLRDPASFAPLPSPAPAPRPSPALPQVPADAPSLEELTRPQQEVRTIRKPVSQIRAEREARGEPLEPSGVSPTIRQIQQRIAPEPEQVLETPTEPVAPIRPPMPTRPPPPRVQPEEVSGAGRTADIEDVQARGDIRGPYGTTSAIEPQPEAPQQTASQQIQSRLAKQGQQVEEIKANIEQLKSSADKQIETGGRGVPRGETPQEDKGPKEEDEEVEAGAETSTLESAGGALGAAGAIGEGAEILADKDATGAQKAESLGKAGAVLGAGLAGGPILGGGVALAEDIAGPGTAAQKAKGAATIAGVTGGVMAASAAIPGAGEVLAGLIGIGSLIADAVKHHKEVEQQKDDTPQPPKAPQLPGVAFDAAPVLDSSDFHAL